MKWLQLGDQNTSYFHKVVSSNKSKCVIDSLITDIGIVLSKEDEVIGEIRSFCKKILGTPEPYCKRLRSFL